MVSFVNRRMLCLVGCAIAALFTSLQEASAGYAVNAGDIIKITDGPGGGNGGEFKVNAGPNATTDDWRTFCVQKNQHLGFNENLKVEALSQSTEGGSTYNSTTGTQYLTARTSALYREFLRGQNFVSNNNPGPNNTDRLFLGAYTTNVYYRHNDTSASLPDDGKAIQEAMWFYQNQLMAINAANIASLMASNKFVNAVEALATAKGWGNALTNGGISAASLTSAQGSSLYGGVEIMQIRRWSTVTGSYSTEGQDLLAYTGSDGFSEVPEPSTLVLFGLGIFGAVLARRRRNPAIQTV